MVIEYSIVHKFYYRNACNLTDSMPKLCPKANGILDLNEVTMYCNNIAPYIARVIHIYFYETFSNFQLKTRAEISNNATCIHYIV